MSRSEANTLDAVKSSAELRQSFLDFFSSHGHTVVPSSSLVPASDPTLLFTNAGMVQFKDVFLGREHRDYRRAVSSQRCVRAGGKHNDLENVGYTARHHTFFEMLGNFSFGDYFKREAIGYAWSFLTEVLGLPPERLWVTVFESDDEAADIWLKEIGVDPQRFARIGAKDNFWSMGETGPCGPCTEIFYDHGPEVAGGPPGSPEAEGDRYVEIWNLVFMQYDRDREGNLNPLPRPSVDTGMGLERLAAVMQGVHSNYDIDLFQSLIGAAARLTGCDDHRDNSLKVIADHIRACAFLIVDGVLPSNEGRGYVLRRIIRRAVRHGYKLGTNEPFFHRMVEPLAAQMGRAYHELTDGRAHIERVLLTEEERFAETLEQGMRLLESAMADLADNVLSGETAFKLYDTYGFPVDLTADIAREKGLKIDMQGFEAAMEAQRARGRAASQFDADYEGGLEVEVPTVFTGYEQTQDRAQVIALAGPREDNAELVEGEQGVVALDHTPFYAESGGQVGDTGILSGPAGRFQVEDTRKQSGDVFAHYGTVTEGRLRVGDPVQAQVDVNRRQAVALNHSATHLLHAALRKLLGDHVSQKGSLVAPDRLRFDFSHYEPLTPEQIAALESTVNEQIRANAEAETRTMPYQQAVAAGALALFGEKYGDEVRVLRLGEFSTELCGGIHVRRAGDIGLFKILSESGIASGVRRIEAVTGRQALSVVDRNGQHLARMAELLKADREGAEDKLRLLLDRTRQMEKELAKLKGQLASNAGGELAERAVDVDGIKVLAACLDGVDPKSLRETVDQLKNKLGSAAVVLATVSGEKVSLVAGVTKDRTAQLKAGELVNQVAAQVGGKGGGRADMAQAGGNQPQHLETALQSVPDWVRQRIH